MSFLNGTDPGLRQTRTPTVDLFTAGVDFTAGSSTQVTLTNDPGSENNVIITFDGIVQHRDTYSISGAVVTFDAAIPTGVTDVEATYTTTQPVSEPADNSVTLAKLSDGTQGGLIYYGGSGAPTELAAGTSGQYLQTQGAGANPQWATLASGGMTHLATATASGTTMEITGIDSSEYFYFHAQIDDIGSATNPSYLRFYLGNDSGYYTSKFSSYGIKDIHSADTTTVHRGDYLETQNFGYSSGGEKYMRFFIQGTKTGMPSATVYVDYIAVQREHNTGSNPGSMFGMGILENAPTLPFTKMKWVSSAGSITGTGKVHLFGVK